MDSDNLTGRFLDAGFDPRNVVSRVIISFSGILAFHTLL